MYNDFSKYTEISVNALKFNPKAQEVIDKKKEILQSISLHYKSSPTSTLFYGFSPLMLGSSSKQLAVTAITDQTKKYLDSLNIKYVYIKEDDLGQYKKQFNWVVVGDEFFTFAKSEQEQMNNIQAISGMAKDLVITTLRDYKNQDFKDREFSQPLAVHNQGQTKIFLEYHDYDFADKNSWNTTVYELDSANSQVSTAFARRTMFFKQMAKFSIDAGAKDFYVHKNLMYKSLIKKNYEHVISIKF